jgi:hypothetical protein
MHNKNKKESAFKKLCKTYFFFFFFVALQHPHGIVVHLKNIE